MPALITPFHADGSVNTSIVPSLVDMHLAAGVGGLYLCGSTGEGLFMSVEERKTMTEAVTAAMRAKEADKRVPVVVMVACENVDDAVALAVHAKEAGADAISAVTPPGKPKNADSAAEYWTKIAGAADLPFYLYWVAETADQSVTPESFLAKMKTVPNFAGFKFTDKNFYKFQQLMALGAQAGGVNGVTGPDEMMVGGFIMGSDGCIGSTYNIYPKLAIRAHKSFLAGDNKQATECQWAMNKIINLLLTLVPCVQTGIKIIYRRKYGMDVGTTKPALAAAPTQAQEDALMAALEDCVFE